MTIKEYTKIRNKKLESDNKEDWIELYKIAGHPIPENEIVFLASVHKARTAIPALSLSKRLESKKWLNEHGFYSFDDGELTQ